MENKTSKYFKYAIGEIILVVIGILIALQVNNWNTKRNESKASKNLMSRLLIESNKNQEALNENIERIKSLMTDSERLLQFMGNAFTNKNEKTIDTLIYSVLASPSLNYKSSTLDEALSSGAISLIVSDSLRDLLYQIPSIYEIIKRTEKNEDEDSTNNLIPYFYDNISLRQVDYRFAPIKDRIGKSELDYSDNRIILNDRKFESIIDNKMFLLNTALNRNIEYQKFNSKTIKLLEQEIAKLN
ncbi:hypothetical protein [Winogradskyella flava]|uniref:Uncharacterized protein n=1 Tax=Winogradskyella flava TaxID=1884876 RepID=A0A842ITX0_9FLAO|nr:hypothetical protein [Winogradskyella flava]MBC2846381.1 hypothetical protein [Winogradskyella flava]